MKEYLKSFLVIICTTAVIFSCSAAAFAGEGSTGSAVRSVTAVTQNFGFGKEAVRIEIEIEDTAPYMGLAAEDFLIVGCCVDKREGYEIDVVPDRVMFTADRVILEVPRFIAESAGHKYHMECTDPSLDFVYEDVSCVVLNNDLFEQKEITYENTTVQYQIYEPAAEEPLPIVVYNHGRGCRGIDFVLTDDCFAAAWVTDDSQNEYPCFVLAPFRASVKDDTVDTNSEMAAIKGIIDGLVEEGKVDPERIYFGGESMGCMFTAQFVSRYPGYLAAAFFMNGGPFDLDPEATFEEAMEVDFAPPYSDAELKQLAESGTAAFIIQGLGDTISLPVRLGAVYEKLVGFGMIPGNNIVWEPYTAEQYNHLLRSVTKVREPDTEGTAVDPITGVETWINGLFHNTSRVACWDTLFRTWLFDQKLEK